MLAFVLSRVGVTALLALAHFAIAGATPNKAVEIEIDGKGVQKTKPYRSRDVPHPGAHEKKLTEAEHSHASKASHDIHVKEVSNEAKKQDAKKPNEDVPESKAELHHTISDKVPHDHPSTGRDKQQHVFTDEEDYDDDDAALDELEAMTIARTFERKHPPPYKPPPKINCKWGPWEEFGSCPMTCGGAGKLGQRMKRDEKPPAQHHGDLCTGSSQQKIDCATEACPTTTTTTEEEISTTIGAGAPRMADLSHLALLPALVLASTLLQC